MDLAHPPRQLPRSRSSSSATWRRRSPPAEDRRRPLRRADRPLRARDGPGRERGPHGLLRADAPARDREAARRHATRPRASSTASSDAPEPGVPRPARSRSTRHRRGLRDPRRPDRHRTADRPADQHAARGHGRHRDLPDDPLDPARQRSPRRRPGQLRPLPADHDHRARGLPREPALPGADDRALLPRQHRRRHGHARARAARARTASAPASAT